MILTSFVGSEGVPGRNLLHLRSKKAWIEKANITVDKINCMSESNFLSSRNPRVSEYIEQSSYNLQFIILYGFVHLLYIVKNPPQLKQIEQRLISRNCWPLIPIFIMPGKEFVQSNTAEKSNNIHSISKQKSEKKSICN